MTRVLTPRQANAIAQAVIDAEDQAAAPAVLKATCRLLDAAEAEIEKAAARGAKGCVLIGRDASRLLAGVRGRHGELALANVVAILCARGFDASGDVLRVHMLRIGFNDPEI